MRLRIQHKTRFDYENLVSESHNEVRLMPLTDDDQTLMHFRVNVAPNANVFSYPLRSGYVHHFNIREPHASLEIVTEARVDTRSANPFLTLNLVDDDWSYYEDDNVRQDFAEYLSPTRLVVLQPDSAAMADEARSEAGSSVASFLLALNRHLHQSIIYEHGATDVTTSTPELVEDLRGVCQDFTHLMLSICRSEGIPCRYVSGYTYISNADGALRGSEAMHSWVECLLPDGCWHGFDPTNNLLANDRFVKVHVGRDYNDVSPTRGVLRGASAAKPDVQVTVFRE